MTSTFTSTFASTSISPYILGGKFTSNGLTIKIVELIPKVHENCTLEMVVALLEHLLEENVWGRNYGDFREILTPSSVIATHQPADHWKRINDADLSYPILVYFNDNGYLNVIDGMHRLSKAVINNHDYILVKVVDKSQMM